MKRSIILICAVCVVNLLAMFAPAEGKEIGTAVSIKNLQEQLKDCMNSRNCPDYLLNLAGLTYIGGFIIDPQNSDLVFYGESSENAEPLKTEDLAAALKNAWQRYSKMDGNTRIISDPSCSIDYDAEYIKIMDSIFNLAFSMPTSRERERELENWTEASRNLMEVTVKGIRHKTHFAKTMVEADYFVKRLADGSAVLPNNLLISMAEMWENDMGSSSMARGLMSRFEFMPGDYWFCENPFAIHITNCPIKLITEEQTVEDDKIKGTGTSDLFSKRFADEFTENYSLIADIKPIYRDLENLFRFVTLAKLMYYRDVQDYVNLDYLLDKYEVLFTFVNDSLPGISRILNEVDTTVTEVEDGILTRIQESYLLLCGGVNIKIDITPEDLFWDFSGQLRDEQKAIIDARPSPNAVTWQYQRNRKSEGVPWGSSPGKVSPPITKVPQHIIESRRAKAKEALKHLNPEKKPIILDFYVERATGACHLDIIDWTGKIHECSIIDAQKFGRLLDIACAAKYGKFGRQYLKEWEDFYKEHLEALNVNTPDQSLWLSSNIPEEGFPRIPQISILDNNFSINLNMGDAREDLDLAAAHIREVHDIKNNNTLIIITPPELDEESEMAMNNMASELKEIMGSENVAYRPTKQECLDKIENSSKENVIIIFESKNGIRCKNDEVIDNSDLSEIEDLSNFGKIILIGCRTIDLINSSILLHFHSEGTASVFCTADYMDIGAIAELIQRLINMLKGNEEKRKPDEYQESPIMEFLIPITEIDASENVEYLFCSRVVIDYLPGVLRPEERQAA